jgi:citrate lyase subunit beta/citryl-CoA lyase
MFAHRVDSTEGPMRLRALLFVPGDRPDRMEKAARAGADALILDLEDAVAATCKAEARIHVARFLGQTPRELPVLVRINPLSSANCVLDLAALVGTKPAGIVLPKAEGRESVLELGRRCTAMQLPIWPILPLATETPRAVFRLGEFAAVADRLMGISWGAEDLPAAMGAATSRLPDGSFTPPYEVVRALTLFAAHAAGVAAIETVYPAHRDLDGLAAYARRGARDGFTGMLAIHPSQVAVINAAFTPSAEALAYARRVVAEFRAHPGEGVLSLDGMMLDAPHLKRAEDIIARAATSKDI